MGIHDRDYYRDTLPRGGFGYFRFGSVTTWLIVVNVVVFFLDVALRRAAVGDGQSPDFGDGPGDYRAYMFWMMGPLQRWGYFSIDKAIYGLQIWRLVSFQFLHASPSHLLFNMIAMYLFGPIVEGHFGARRYLAFYLLCGLAGAAMYAGLSVGHVLGSAPEAPLVGASAGIYGLLVAAALIAQDVQVFYYLFPVTIGMLAALSMLTALYQVIAAGFNAGGEAAHLGGGILGFVFMRNQHLLNLFAPARRMAVRRTAPARRRRRSVMQKDWSKDMNR